jgi:hypothetical protein
MEMGTIGVRFPYAPLRKIKKETQRPSPLAKKVGCEILRNKSKEI